MMKKLRRDIVVKRMAGDHYDEDFVEGTPAYRMGIMWDITIDVWAFAGNRDAERRLQRDVTNIIRGGR